LVDKELIRAPGLSFECPDLAWKDNQRHEAATRLQRAASVSVDRNLAEPDFSEWCGKRTVSKSFEQNWLSGASPVSGVPSRHG
jgi:hypothetical protein